MLSVRFTSSLLSLLLLVSSTFMPACAQSELDPSVGKKMALVVGVSKFKNPEINLQYAEKDAKDFAQFLTDKAGFMPDNVHVLTNEKATLKGILTDLGSNWLPALADPEDLVVIFMSSHGSPAEMDRANFNYILAYDSEVDNLYATALDMQDIVDVISRRIKSKRIVLILDACHAGAMLKDSKQAGSKGLTRTGLDLDNVQLGSGKVIFLSSLPHEKSWELKAVQNSIFTRCLIDTLSKANEATSLDSVFKNLKTSVLSIAIRERGVTQTPVMKSTWMGKEPILALAPRVPGISQPPVVSQPAQTAALPPTTSAASTTTTTTTSAATTTTTASTTATTTTTSAATTTATATAASTTATVAPGSATLATTGVPFTGSPAGPDNPRPGIGSTVIASAGVDPPTRRGNRNNRRPPAPPVQNNAQDSQLAFPAAPATNGNLPANIAVIPFTGPFRVNIAPSQNVLWGKVANASELANLAPKMTAKMFVELRSEYKNRTVGPRTVSLAISDNAVLAVGQKVDTTKWSADQWKRIGRDLQAKYLITGSVDTAAWATSFTSNKYDVTVSANLVSGDTGEVLSTVRGLKVHKAPWQGDLGGGQKYFENEVMAEASEQLVKQFKSILKTPKK
jgi:hypothetical protein